MMSSASAVSALEGAPPVPVPESAPPPLAAPSFDPGLALLLPPLLFPPKLKLVCGLWLQLDAPVPGLGLDVGEIVSDGDADGPVS